MTQGLLSIARPCLIEVAGVAGAGKSTLTRSVCERPGFHVGGFIHTRRPSHLLQVLKGTPRSLPVLVSGGWRSPRLSWAEFKLMVYVTRWRSVFRRETRHDGGITVLDQGPIYALVRLKAEGKPFTTTRAFERWWDDMLALWARELDVIVWLDAPDEVLRDRINGRPQQHRQKGRHADEAQRFLSRYRLAFEGALSTLESLGTPEVLRYDTGRTTTAQLASTIQPLLMAHARS
ncbi:MAG: nucleoside monophosphate kinase [Actinomycetota bacterium]|nr:nucleoside monophosphate kinase [Actinomycetota bacterium]